VSYFAFPAISASDDWRVLLTPRFWPLAVRLFGMPEVGASPVLFRALYGFHKLFASRAKEPRIVGVVNLESVQEMVYGIRGVNVL
jgi:hypothetical protein